MRSAGYVNILHDAELCVSIESVTQIPNIVPISNFSTLGLLPLSNWFSVPVNSLVIWPPVSSMLLKNT